MRHRDLRQPEQQTLALVLAGGSGARLGPLTRWQAKPALPFGGQYRNIDFPLSNCVNSGIRRVALLTQYKSHSLIRHVQQGWSFLRPEAGEFIELWPAQQRRGSGWYAGTADAVFQNIDLIEDHGARHVLVLAGDHVYSMDYRRMLDQHVANAADVTVGCVEVPIADASAYGVLSVDRDRRIMRFDEKPAQPVALPDQPGRVLASMGIYVFRTGVLLERLLADAQNSSSGHDFGHDVLPSMIDQGGVHACAFRTRDGTAQGYWRDVGTVDSYWQANMELLAEHPDLDLHDRDWPIRTFQPQCAPPRFISEGWAKRSIVSGGCTVSGAIDHSVLSHGCRIGDGSRVAHSVLLPDVRIGRGCQVRRAVIDSGCVIPDGTVIDGCHGSPVHSFHLSAKGVALVTADMLQPSRSCGDAGERRKVA